MRQKFPKFLEDLLENVSLHQPEGDEDEDRFFDCRESVGSLANGSCNNLLLLDDSTSSLASAEEGGEEEGSPERHFSVFVPNSPERPRCRDLRELKEFLGSPLGKTKGKRSSFFSD
jgi:hypothetical protein